MGRTQADWKSDRVITEGSVLGTYIHGFFDEPEIAEGLLSILFERKKIKKPVPKIESHSMVLEKDLDKLADCLRESLDMDLIYRAIGI